MKQGMTLDSMARELVRQSQSMQDMLVHPKSLSYRTGSETHTGELVVHSERRGQQSFAVTDHARAQLAEVLGIPYGYFERMREEQPELLDHNVNTWLHRNPVAKERLVRTLDGKVRAVLSSKYRRLDHRPLFEAIYPMLKELPGARFDSVQLTETRMYVKVISERLCCEVNVGDVVQAGIVISNSEVGCGSLSIAPLLYRLLCKNGLIAPDSAFKRNHVGKTLQLGVDMELDVLSQETIAANDRALFMTVGDVVQHTLSQSTLELMATKMRNTLGIQIKGDPVASVQVLANRYAMKTEEQSGVLAELIRGADLSAFGLINAVTAYAQQVDSYDRATELEQVGGQMLEMDAGEWQHIVTAKPKETKR